MPQGQRQGMALGIAAMIIYVIGGVSCFGGIALVVLMKGRDLLGWGDGRSIGYLFACSGVALSILGVLMMRIFRNRGLT
ncbi:MAG TPA: hypothetical protein HPP76_11305 [Desulfuromonadales bacterium]|nr:hypothetical protein [Desulfuromonadales bacterium]